MQFVYISSCIDDLLLRIHRENYKTKFVHGWMQNIHHMYICIVHTHGLPILMHFHGNMDTTYDVWWYEMIVGVYMYIMYSSVDFIRTVVRLMHSKKWFHLNFYVRSVNSQRIIYIWLNENFRKNGKYRHFLIVFKSTMAKNNKMNVFNSQ